MAEGRSRDEWNRVASLMALLANLHRDPKKRGPFKPGDFLPRRETKEQPCEDGFALMKNVFVDRQV